MADGRCRESRLDFNHKHSREGRGPRAFGARLSPIERDASGAARPGALSFLASRANIEFCRSGTFQGHGCVPGKPRGA